MQPLRSIKQKSTVPVLKTFRATWHVIMLRFNTPSVSAPRQETSPSSPRRRKPRRRQDKEQVVLETNHHTTIEGDRVLLKRITK